MERLYAKSDPRDIQIYYKYNKKELPYFCLGWEDDFLKSNNVEKAILSISHATRANDLLKERLKSEQANSNLLTIPFEEFVLSPEPFISNITNLLGTEMGASKDALAIIDLLSENYERHYNYSP
jgi:hypothetical protein